MLSSTLLKFFSTVLKKPKEPKKQSQKKMMNYEAVIIMIDI